MSRGLLMAGALLAACGQETPVPAPQQPGPAAPSEAVAAEREALSRCGPMTAQGFCGVTFGMTADQARAAFPVAFDMPEGQDAGDSGRCHELFPVAPVTGISFLLESGRVGRIDVIGETVRTAEGFGVGTSASDLRAAYGAAAAETANALEPEVTDLAVTQGDAKFVFEIVNGVVRAWRAGVPPAVDYPAHCG